MIRDVPPFRRAAVLIAIVLFVIGMVGVVVTVALTLSAAPAAAQTTTNVSDVAPYYANESTAVGNASWYENTENATLDSMGEMATRILFYIGYGEMAPDNAGYQGLLITGIVMIAMFLGAVAMLPVGSVGGGVLAILVGYGMTELGLAPGWFRAVLVAVVSLFAVFVAIRQALQAR